MKNYETPAIFELGKTEELTLGKAGCFVSDCCGGYIDSADPAEAAEEQMAN